MLSFVWLGMRVPQITGWTDALRNALEVDPLWHQPEI